MKSKTKQGAHRFPLNVLHYGNSYYIERIAALETAVAKCPRQLQIDMLGEGEVPADWALLIRSILGQRSPKTQIVTNARSSLQNGSVLVWLLGDHRMIRDDARLFFRRADVSDDNVGNADTVWKEGDLKYSNSYTETDLDEADHAKVLQHINEFLPVKELMGKVVDVRVLRQFGLVENEKLDRFLATAFGQPQRRGEGLVSESKQVRSKSKTTQPVSVKK
jgi:hypothetical protein